jgi:hypothetical protein
MTVERHENALRVWNIREWLLSLLRFAVTREQSDHAIALSIADKLDSTGGQWWPAAPRFFIRTTDEVCAAISVMADGRTSAVLRQHLERIDDPRLRRAFQAALGLQETHEPDWKRETRPRAKSNDLWRGLPVRVNRRAYGTD